MSTMPEPDKKIPHPGEEWAGEHPETGHGREDERWSAREQLRDWGILLVMIVAYLIWTGILYLFEPGIR